MIESKAWKWEMVRGEREDYWKRPAAEALYLVSRWKVGGRKAFLDLGCGIGRHAALFAEAGFETSAIDLSKDAVEKAKRWVSEEGLKVDFKTGDMLSLPYKNEAFDCLLSYYVITHSDTAGVKKTVGEIYRVLQKGGECYLTLQSKDSWGWKQRWPRVDANTYLRMEEGPEYEVPHFCAGYNDIFKLFEDFSIIQLKKIERFLPMKSGKGLHGGSFNWHILLRKGEGEFEI
jgi:ubiquinone/menaquinone biosynthesis C-methylase UbiE